MPRKDSKETILDAAESLFASRGFDATTIKQIGARARVNPALLYYYFGDKQALYRAVLARLIGGLAETVGGRLREASSPEDAIHGVIQAQMEVLGAHPDLARIFVREMVEHRGENAADPISDSMTKVFTRLCGIIEQGQRAGLFRKKLDARFAAISVVSQVVYVHVARPAVGMLLGEGRKGVSEKTMKKFGAHAVEFALAALEERPRRRARAGRLKRASALLLLLAGVACAGGDDDRIEGTGTIEVVEMDVASLIPARVARVLVDEGQSVRAGETLALLTQAATSSEVEIRRAALQRAEAVLRDLEAGARPAEVRQSSAEVTASEAEAARLARDYSRAQALYDGGAISRQELEAARTQATVAAQRASAVRQGRQLVVEGTRPERINAARADVATARAALDAARGTAAELALTAPVSGTIIRRLADPGETVAAGEPVVTLGKTDSLWVRIYLSPGDVARIRVGDPARAALDDFPSRHYAGRVTAIASRAEFTPRVALTERERADLLFGVKVTLADTTGALKAGLPVTVRIEPRGTRAAAP
jgi:HlyD family secretion protein